MKQQKEEGTEHGKQGNRDNPGYFVGRIPFAVEDDDEDTGAQNDHDEKDRFCMLFAPGKCDGGQKKKLKHDERQRYAGPAEYQPENGVFRDSLNFFKVVVTEVVAEFFRAVHGASFLSLFRI